MINIDIGGIVKTVGDLADDLFTSDEERARFALEERKIQSEEIQGQLAVNTAEAKHKSVFVAGWRPFIGWVGGSALAYQFILYPLGLWLLAMLKGFGVVPQEIEPPPVLPTEALWTVISGMLGIAGMRSYDKKRGTVTDAIRRK